MKIIELLNRIANGEIKEIQRFLFEGKCYNQCSNIEKFSMFKTYYYVNGKETEYTTLGNIFDIENLNRLIVIEEDKKIEKIKTKIGYGHLVYLENESFKDGDMGFTNRENVIVDKINEIIDYLNKGDK